jgi:hypothetical protein
LRSLAFSCNRIILATQNDTLLARLIIARTFGALYASLVLFHDWLSSSEG